MPGQLKLGDGLRRASEMACERERFVEFDVFLEDVSRAERNLVSLKGMRSEHYRGKTHVLAIGIHTYDTKFWN
jgi:hypothetical protein